jgi:hypothetical protein
VELEYLLETSGTDNKYLYMAIVLAEGEINSIEEIRIDDKAVTWSGSLTMVQLENS